MIRDYGTLVEFWVRAGYSNFWWDGLPFSFTANGRTYNVSINYPSGGGWFKVGSINVTTSQTVYFRLLKDTNTSSLAGPTTMGQYLDRGSVPDPTSPVSFSNVKFRTLDASFSDGSNGGLAIDTRQIAYNQINSPNASGTVFVTSDRSTSISNLIPGTTYWFWARAHNSKGWGPWNAGRSVMTMGGGTILVGPSRKKIIPWVKVNGVWRQARPWSKRSGSWKATK